MNTNSITKYFVYLRKSTEGEERQVLSIESQKDKILETFSNLEIIEILEERHSAFKPYNRPIFEGMIKRIQKGEANGIIAWHPDRLSRNEIDASTLTYLVRTNIINDLKFDSYNFDNSPEGIMMLQLALSQSQYFSSKLGKDVKRGLQKKIQMGWRPGLAPEGYLNIIGQQQGLKGIKIDKKRFTLLRKAFDKMLTGNYSAIEILNNLNNDWGYKTVKRRKVGGNKLSKSTWYKILANPFYAGINIFNGIETKGKHKPMITINEYNHIQKLLGKKGSKRQPKERNFIYSGVFKCSDCGCSITAEHKTKLIKKTRTIKEYNYYHCTHKKKDFLCKQASIEERIVNRQALKALERLKMHHTLLNWALDYINEQKFENNSNKNTFNIKIEEIKKQISTLTSMRIRDLLTDEEYLKEKINFKNKLKHITQKEKNRPNEIKISELTKEAFKFSYSALENFKKEKKIKKKEVLFKLGSNHKIKDKKAHFSIHKWLLPIYNNAKQFSAELVRLEPTETLINTIQKEAFTSLRLRWHGMRESNPRRLVWSQTCYHYTNPADIKLIYSFSL